MARTVKQVDAYINGLFYQCLSQEVLDKINLREVKCRTSGIFAEVWQRYIHNHRSGLVTKKSRQQASLSGLKTALNQSGSYSTSDLICFFRSNHGNMLIKQYFKTIFPSSTGDSLSLYAHGLYVNNREVIKSTIISELEKRCKIKASLQKFYNKYYHQLIQKKMPASLVVDNYFDNNLLERDKAKLEKEKQSLIQDVIDVEVQQMSCIYGLQDLHMRYNPSLGYHADIHVPVIQKYRMQLKKLEDRMLKKLNSLIDVFEKELLLNKAKSFFNRYLNRVLGQHIRHSDCDVFIEQHDIDNLDSEISSNALGLLREKLEQLYRQYRAGYVVSNQNLSSHISSAYLREIFVSSNQLSLARLNSSMQHQISDSAIEALKVSALQQTDFRRPSHGIAKIRQKFKNHEERSSGILIKPKRYVPASSRIIEALPAGTLVTVGALSNDILDSIGANGYYLLTGARDFSGSVGKVSEIKSSIMEKTNTLMGYTGHSQHGFVINEGLITGVGMLAVSAKLANSCLALINAIECRVRLDVKRSLILNAIALTFDDRVWYCLSVMQKIACNIGLSEQQSLRQLQKLFYGQSVVYDSKLGFAKFLTNLIQYVKSNIELMVNKAYSGKLSLLEAVLLYGLVLDRQSSVVSSYELSVLLTEITRCNQALDELIGLESLPDGDTYKDFIKTHKLAVECLVTSIFNYVRLENVRESSNKDIVFAVTKSAIHACTLAVSSTALAGVGGLTIAMLPATFEGVDKLSDVIYAHVNPTSKEFHTIAAKIHASAISEELSQQVSKLQTLYDIHHLNHEDFPDKIFQVRAEMQLKLKKKTHDGGSDCEIVLRNTAEIKLYKRKISRLEHELHNISCEKRQACIMHEITCCNSELKNLLSENSRIVHNNLDHEKLAIDYYDHAVFMMLMQPLVNGFIQRLSQVNLDKDRFATSGDKIALQQTLAKMKHYMAGVSIVNLHQISRDLLIIAQHDGFTKIFKPVIATIKRELLESRVKQKVEAHILFYRAHICTSPVEARKLLSLCNMDLICSSDTHTMDTLCRQEASKSDVVYKKRAMSR